MTDSPILAIAARAAQLRRQGVDVISLAAGEPDTPAAAPIVAAAAAALERPDYHHYGPRQGLPELRATIALQLTGILDLPYTADDIVTLGAKHALFLALHAICRTGDRVLVASPGWPGHHGAIAAVGGTSVHVPAAAEDNFLLDPRALERAWQPGTRALILASPANPTGSVYDADRLVAIAEWAEKREVWIISDDIYRSFAYDREHVPLLAVAPGARARTIVVDGVSKAHAMTGWRVGWLAAPQNVVGAATTHIGQTVTNVPQFTQAAAHIAIADPRPVAATAASYRNRRNRLHKALNQLSGIQCPLPDGGMFVFPSVSDLLTDNSRRITSSAELATWLLDEARVATVPGEFFDAPGRLRMCFAVDDHTLDTAIERLSRALSTLAQRPSANLPRHRLRPAARLWRTATGPADARR